MSEHGEEVHGCQVQTTEGDDLSTCGEPGELWDAPSGRSFYVCPRHVERFEHLRPHSGSSDASGESR